MLGDFNINLQLPSKERSKLLGTAAEYNFKQLINFTTRSGMRLESGMIITTEINLCKKTQKLKTSSSVN